MSLQQTLKALADPTRREILNMLKGGKRSAGEIAEQFDITAAAVSRHLSVLKEADLIEDTRDGKYIFYELNASVLEEILRQDMSVAKTESYVQALVQARQSRPRQVNVGTFLDSLTRNLQKIQLSGIPAISERTETEDRIVLTITIPK